MECNLIIVKFIFTKWFYKVKYELIFLKFIIFKCLYLVAYFSIGVPKAVCATSCPSTRAT